MKNISVITLILVNLVPLFGVLFFDWSLFMIMFLFWFENIVIGFVNVPKIIKADGEYSQGDKKFNIKINNKIINTTSKYALAGFFMLHYGIFTFVHGIFIFVLFYEKLDSYQGIALAVLLLFVSHGVSYYTNYIGKEEYKKLSSIQVMTQPYKRIVIMHLTIILGGVLSMSLGAPTYAVAVLVGLKIFVDIIAHKKEHNFSLN